MHELYSASFPSGSRIVTVPVIMKLRLKLTKSNNINEDQRRLFELWSAKWFGLVDASAIKKGDSVYNKLNDTFMMREDDFVYFVRHIQEAIVEKAKEAISTPLEIKRDETLTVEGMRKAREQLYAAYGPTLFRPITSLKDIC